MFADAGLELFSLLRRDIDNLHAVSDSIPLRETREREREVVFLIKFEKIFYQLFIALLSLSQNQISTE